MIVAFAIAAAVNVVTGLLIDDWNLGAWIALGVLVLVGGGLQILLSRAPNQNRAKQRMRGVRAGGSVLQSGDKVSKKMYGIQSGGDVHQKGKDSEQVMRKVRADRDVTQEAPRTDQ
ncbi:hypothetical protein [Actinomadura spongiicola]|uniref:hypothetical protein n=1 Tax=Actinomadura spongiicola TaxID=2303421 RepID=UPI0011C16AD8|nr:hypothetical protein [Actinomadura spongiicola]